MASIWEKITPGGSAVLARFVDAWETNLADRSRLGPKAYGNSMPTYLFSDTELFAMRVEDELNNKGRHFERIRKDKAKQIEQAAKLSRERISRAEQCESWWQLIDDPEGRLMVKMFAFSVAVGRPWSAVMGKMNRKKKPQEQWTKNNSRRQIHKELQILFERLESRGILLDLSEDCQVSQITAESEGKSISSRLHAWSEERWKPVLETDEQPPQA